MSASSPALTVEQAAAALCAMINASPRSPRRSEIEAIVGRTVAHPATMPLSSVEAQLLEAVIECHAAEKALNQAGDDEDAIARYEAAMERMNGLADQLPTPAGSLANVMLRGHVAYLHSDRDERGTLSWLSSDDYGEAAAARLVAEVMQYAGVDLR